MRAAAVLRAEVSGQQAGATGPIAAVELDAEHADGVEANADSACGITRLNAQHRALCPLRRSVTLCRGRAVTKVTTEVEVAQFHTRFAVGNKVGRGGHW